MKICQAAKAVELLELFMDFSQEAAFFTATKGGLAARVSGFVVAPLPLSQLLQSQAARQWLIYIADVEIRLDMLS